MSKQKWRNRTLERGVVIDKRRGYAYVRYKLHGTTRKELIGRVADIDVIDKANFRAQEIRRQRRAELPGFEVRKQRMLVEDAADLFFELHGKKRESVKGIRQFARYVDLIKAAWPGRYVDAITAADMRDYRMKRKATCIYDSTINREQTAIITMFNRLSEWRRTGQVPRHILLPESNPGRGIKKVNEDRFVRERLLSENEFRKIWACADERLRRIILAEMNLPLRLEDLRRLEKKNVNHKLSRLKGVQAKTGREYSLPINEVLWELIRTAPSNNVLDFRGFAKRWKKAVRRAGLKELQFRDIRRTAATALHDGGESLRTISAMLGHASVTTTIRYLGLKEEKLSAAGNLLATIYQPVRACEGLELVGSVPQSVPAILEIQPMKVIEKFDL